MPLELWFLEPNLMIPEPDDSLAALMFQSWSVSGEGQNFLDLLT